MSFGLHLAFSEALDKIFISDLTKIRARAKKIIQAEFRRKRTHSEGVCVIGHEISSSMGLKPSNLPGARE